VVRALSEHDRTLFGGVLFDDNGTRKVNVIGGGADDQFDAYIDN
jgi:hypothetical protein